MERISLQSSAAGQRGVAELHVRVGCADIPTDVCRPSPRAQGREGTSRTGNRRAPQGTDESFRERAGRSRNKPALSGNDGHVSRFSDRLVLTDLAQGPTAVRAVPNGRHRFTFALNVDLRIEKGFRLGERRLVLIAEGFNILDMTNEVEEDVVTGALFRTMTAVPLPRAVRLGVRLDF